MKELKLYDMAKKEEIKAFIKECFSEIPEHPVHADEDVLVLGNKFVEIDISNEDVERERQKDLDKHKMYNDRDWNRSGLGEF